MSLGTSFSTQGATPQNPSLSAFPQSGGTPQSRALTNQSSTPQYAVRAPQTPTQQAYGQPGAVTGYGSSTTPIISSGLLPPVNQDVKSHTAADGTSQTYYPSTSSTGSGASSTPTTPGLINSVATAQKAGAFDSQYGAGQYNQTGGVAPITPITPPATTPASTPTPTTTPTSTTPTTPYGTAVQNVSNISNQGANNINTTSNQGANNILNASQNNSASGQINNLNQTAAGNIPLGQDAQNIANAAGQQISSIGQQGAKAQAGYLTTGTSPVAEGNAAVTAQTTAAQQQAIAQGANMQLQGNAQALTGQNQAQSGYNASGNLALTGQGQAIQGATSAGQLGTQGAESAAGVAQTGAVNAANMTAPQAYGLTTQPYNPTTDTYGGGGAGGAINRAVQASNISSAQDFQSKIQSTQAQENSADKNFDVLNSYATQGTTSSTSPILSALQQKFGQTVGGQDAPAVAGFKAQLQSLRAAYTAITGGDGTAAIPDSITPAQLTQIQQSLKTTAQNNIAGYQKQLNNLSSSSNSSTSGSSGSSSSTFGGSAWS